MQLAILFEIQSGLGTWHIRNYLGDFLDGTQLSLLLAKQKPFKKMVAFFEKLLLRY